jgi:hypothetical protein
VEARTRSLSQSECNGVMGRQVGELRDMPTTLEGTDNADVLVGGSESEVLLGLGGND